MIEHLPSPIPIMPALIGLIEPLGDGAGSDLGGINASVRDVLPVGKEFEVKITGSDWELVDGVVDPKSDTYACFKAPEQTA